MRIIIAGGRDLNDYRLVRQKCDILTQNIKDIEVVSGCARGADKLGEVWAENRGIPIKKFPADWEKYGKKAGIFRNHQMADYADALIAFWDGKSRGTKHMIETARSLNLNVRIVRYENKF